VVLTPSEIEGLFSSLQLGGEFQLTIDLLSQRVITPAGMEFDFAIDPFRKDCLLRNLDDIELTLQHSSDIRSYEAARSLTEPWIFD
jgi:3-isopropylmalate/(R)-2-methylmalate dehydratase small subunit